MRDDVYIIVPAVFFRTATAAHVPSVELDFLQKTVNPSELNSTELTQSLEHFRKWLPNFLASHQVDPVIIQSATLRLVFDYTRTRRSQYDPIDEIPEFICVVKLTDERGVIHVAEPKNWWRS